MRSIIKCDVSLSMCGVIDHMNQMYVTCIQVNVHDGGSDCMRGVLSNTNLKENFWCF